MGLPLPGRSSVKIGGGTRFSLLLIFWVIYRNLEITSFHSSKEGSNPKGIKMERGRFLQIFWELWEQGKKFGRGKTHG
jgi:hypothetical protein